MSARKRTNFAAAATRKERPATPSKTAVRVKPVRITLDLDPELYEQLQTFRRQASVDVDDSVTMAKLSRALYRRLLTDPTLQQDIRADLHEQAHTK